jgi:hypothetical protein
LRERATEHLQAAQSGKAVVEEWRQAIEKLFERYKAWLAESYHPILHPESSNDLPRWHVPSVRILLRTGGSARVRKNPLPAGILPVFAGRLGWQGRPIARQPAGAEGRVMCMLACVGRGPQGRLRRACGPPPHLSGDVAFGAATGCPLR